MSSPPPPPPPSGYIPQQPPPPWSKQDLRAQRRVTNASMRQQRAMARAQRRSNRSTSIIGPVLLIGLGGGLFLLQIGQLSWATALHWLAAWWPLTLVAAGLVLLAEWFLDTRVAHRQGVPVPRRALGTIGVVLLLCLAVVGGGSSMLQRGSAWTWDHWNLMQAWNLEDLFAQHAEAVQQLEAVAEPGAVLAIQDAHGDVTVTGSSSDGKVHVIARQRVWGWQASDLNRRKERNRPKLTGSNHELQLQAATEGRDETDLTIEVPRETHVVVGTGKGELSLSELRGPVHVTDHAGNIQLAALNGDVVLTVRDDDAEISGRSITGSVTVQGRSGDLTFSDVSGQLNLLGDFFGRTHLERIQGQVRFQSSFTRFSCAGLPGELSIEGRSALDGRTIDGPVMLATTDRDINLSELRRGASITDKNGSVTLSFSELSEALEVKTTDGSIKVHVPPAAAFRVDAETADGDIENEFGVPSRKTDEHVSLSGQVGPGGPRMHLQTSEGDIALGKTKAVDQPAIVATPEEHAD